MGTLPITERWSLLGRVGATYAETNSRFSGTGASGVSALSSSKRDTHYKYGFGTEYAFTPALTMRLEGERYRVNDAIGQRADVDLISVGLVYRFGAPAQSVRTAYVAPAVQPVYRPEPVVAQAPVAAPAPPAPVIAPAPAPVVIPAPAPVPKPWVKVKLQADSLFGFDQDSLQADGKQALDKLLQELKDVNVDAVQVTGHTDRLGSAAYNAKLSTRRAEAVRNYLVQVGGMPVNLVTATGVGSSQPETGANECKGMKASQALITCLRVDRRVEVQVLGSQPHHHGTRPASKSKIEESLCRVCPAGHTGAPQQLGGALSIICPCFNTKPFPSRPFSKTAHSCGTTRAARRQ